MPFRRPVTQPPIAGREEPHAIFAVTPLQIAAARDPAAPIGALAGRRQCKQAPRRGAAERKADEAS